MSAASLAVGLLAREPVVSVPKDDLVSPGFLGFVVVFFLATATVLLIRSMVGHLRRVRYAPDPDPPAERDRRR